MTAINHIFEVEVRVKLRLLANTGIRDWYGVIRGIWDSDLLSWEKPVKVMEDWTKLLLFLHKDSSVLKIRSHFMTNVHG